MKNKIYLDNAATTKLDPEAWLAMEHVYKNTWGNPSSIHHMGKETSLALEKARNLIASKLHAGSEEIIFTSSGTESNNLAIKGILGKGDHLITSVIEHPSILKVAKELEKDGIEVTYLSVQQEGKISLSELNHSIRPNTKLVSIQHGNNEIGTIQPIEEIAKTCQEKNIYFHSDACQSFGKIPLNLNSFPISLLSFSAHKVHGPIGAAGLFIKRGIALKPLLHGGGQENNTRSSTINTPAIVGFAEAIKDLNAEDNLHMKRLGDFFIEELFKQQKDITINGPQKSEERLPHIINLSFKNIDGKKLFLKLSEKNIFVSTGSACNASKKTPSLVLQSLGKSKEEAEGSIRFSFSKWTTKDELKQVINELIPLMNQLRDEK